MIKVYLLAAAWWVTESILYRWRYIGHSIGAGKIWWQRNLPKKYQIWCLTRHNMSRSLLFPCICFTVCHRNILPLYSGVLSFVCHMVFSHVLLNFFFCFWKEIQTKLALHFLYISSYYLYFSIQFLGELLIFLEEKSYELEYD